MNHHLSKLSLEQYLRTMNRTQTALTTKLGSRMLTLTKKWEESAENRAELVEVIADLPRSKKDLMLDF